MGSMTGKDGTWCWKGIIHFAYGLFGILFLPVLFCVIFIGNNMDYYEFRKQGVLLPNIVLFAVALAGGIMLFWLSWIFEKYEFTKRLNYGLNGILALFFIFLYFINIQIAKEIVYFLRWDIQEVRGIAEKMASGEPLGYYYYLSVNYNNIPISYILGRLLKAVENIPGYPYFSEFIHVQVNCVLISLGGFFCCLTVKKLTKKIMPVAAALLVYLALPGFSPWKIAPYTDTYGMIFPIMCIYFYFCYRDTQKNFWRYLSVFLSLLSGMCGGLIKPSAYIVVVAVLGVEFVRLLMERGKIWKYFVIEVLMTLCLIFATKECMNCMIEELGLDYNPEINASWETYLLMGLNEETTGSYSDDGMRIITEFQTDKKARKEAARDRAMERIKEKGIGGTIYFWLRKMVLVFNDASFEWQSFGASDNLYPVDVASNTAMTQKLRSLFWPDWPHAGKYHTFCQMVWIFCLIGISGLLMIPKQKRERYLIFAVSFLGIFFYQMLFEARSRYLFVFLPLLIAISSVGMRQYMEWGIKKLQKHTGRKACNGENVICHETETVSFLVEEERKHGREQENAPDEAQGIHQDTRGSGA